MAKNSAERVLVFIKENPGCSQYKISQGLGIEAGTTGTIIQRLKDAGKVERKRRKSKVRGQFKWEIYAK